MDAPQAVGGTASEALLEGGSTARPAGAHDAPGGSPDGGTALHPGLTFESFITGEANRFAYVAALAVARTPALSYNPLFIHGDDGLGKTHLLHAIGNHLRAQHPDLVVRCTSAEQFVLEFVKTIKNHSGDEFRRHYRAVDVLLMDDVQCVAGKEGLQEELFHTFNELFHSGSQLVLTCDIHPRSIPTLTDRLRNRFVAGLLVELQTPDLQTRLDILRAKAERARVDVPDYLLELLASGLQSSIREMEGAVVRLVALHRLMGAPLTQAVAEQVLADVLLTDRPAGR